MNIVSILGYIVGLGLIIYGIIENGDPLSNFWSASSVMIVIGGTVGAVMIGYPWKIIKNMPKMIFMMLKPKKYKPEKYIEQMVEYAKIARTKSLLALEDSANTCPDPFMKSSLMLIVDANDSERVKAMLDDAINFMCDRHEENWSIWEKASSLAPAFGMIGTLIGLINMLANLQENPDGLGAGMSVALITTFYGCILANVFLTPVANRLKAIHSEEVLCMEIVKEGSLAIISGANPRYIQEKLEFMLPKKKEGKEKSKN
ncbi:MAG: motility protein A [Oscillospiraceae bacterium]|jgi:chemotaxis protein MotA